jgi:hypothetical protein
VSSECPSGALLHLVWLAYTEDGDGEGRAGSLGSSCVTDDSAMVFWLPCRRPVPHMMALYYALLSGAFCVLGWSLPVNVPCPLLAVCGLQPSLVLKGGDWRKEPFFVLLPASFESHHRQHAGL